MLVGHYENSNIFIPLFIIMIPQFHYSWTCIIYLWNSFHYEIADIMSARSLSFVYYLWLKINSFFFQQFLVFYFLFKLIIWYYSVFKLLLSIYCKTEYQYCAASQSASHSVLFIFIFSLLLLLFVLVLFVFVRFFAFWPELPLCHQHACPFMTLATSVWYWL